MKVKLTKGIEDQWYDGTQWRSYPPVGKVFETTDEHGADLIASDRAVGVAERAAPETRPAPDAPSEKRGGGPAKS